MGFYNKVTGKQYTTLQVVSYVVLAIGGILVGLGLMALAVFYVFGI